MRHANKVLLMFVIIVLIPTIYGIAYLSLVKRPYFDAERRPTYRWCGASVEVFFAPAHAIDKKLRPDRWRRRIADPYDYDVIEY
jgi:hypothetical protein